MSILLEFNCLNYDVWDFFDLVDDLVVVIICLHCLNYDVWDFFDLVDDLVVVIIFLGKLRIQ
jgi:hypothetical protein